MTNVATKATEAKAKTAPCKSLDSALFDVAFAAGRAAMAARFNNPDGVQVGVAPGGDTWTAWREQGETAEAFASKVATMHDALADFWRRAASRKVA